MMTNGPICSCSCGRVPGQRQMHLCPATRLINPISAIASCPRSGRAGNEMGRRLVAPADSFVFYNTQPRETLSVEPRRRTKNQPLSDTWFGKMVSGFGRKLGTEVKVLVAAHYVPGHYCPSFVDFERGRFVYTDPYFDFVDKNSDYGLTARRRRLSCASTSSRSLSARSPFATSARGTCSTSKPRSSQTRRAAASAF